MRRNAAASLRASVLSAIPFEPDTGNCSALVISDRGASRTPTSRRRLLMHLLPAHLIQVSDLHEAVRAGPSLSSATCAASGAGLSAALRFACAAAFQRKAHLATRESDRTRSACGVAAHEVDIVGEPIEDVASQPTDPPAAKTLLSRKAPEQRQRCEYPAMAPREPRHVMGSQELFEGRKSFIDPFRE